MKLLQRLRNIYKLGEVEIKDGKLLPPSVKAEEKPRLAQIIKMKDEEKIIKEILTEE